MRLITLSAALLTFAAVLASTAVAGSGGQPVRPDDRAGTLGVGATIGAEGTQPVRPDDRAGLGGVGRADVIVAASGRLDGRLLPDGADGAFRPTLVLVDRDGFDWGDATIGAFGAVGLCLLATGLGIAARRTRRTADRHVAV